MAKRKKKLPGLNRHENGNWHLDKNIHGHGRIYRSCRTADYIEAERRAIRWIKELEDAAIFGKKTRITFNQAAALYVDTQIKKSLKNDISDLKKMMPYIGTLYIDQVYQDTIDPYIKAEQKLGKKASTINRSLRILSRVLKLCAVSWRDDNHISYLDSAPLIRQLEETDKVTTSPIEYHEEKALMKELLPHLRDFWEFAVNTGIREQTQVRLRWEWKVEIEALNTYAFVIPSYISDMGTDRDGKKLTNEKVKNTKNGKDFLLVLNSKAKAIIDKWQGRNEVYVFPNPKGSHYSRYNNNPFRRARERAGLKGVIKWHSARTTFATRLRAAGVNKEDRAQLLGHSKNITTQYSWASIEHLISCVERLCVELDTSAEQQMDLKSLFRLGN